ncbi:G-protein coupled receptor 55-like [Rhinophrynus dorsalis]
MNVSQYNCSFSDVDVITYSLQLGIYIPTFITGTILNTFALWILCFSMKRRTEALIYMMNLAVLDLLLLLSLLLKMYFSQQSRTLNLSLCRFAESLYFNNMYGSIYTITFISLDRYIAIRHPFWAKTLRSPKKTKAVCILIWVFVWTVSACTFRFYNVNKESGRCFHNMSDHIWSTQVIVSVEVFGFLIPVIIMLYCSIQIIRTLVANRSTSEQAKRSRVTIIQIIVSNLVVFLLSFSPSHLGIFLQFLVRQGVILDCSHKQHISLFVQVALCLANINCCLDAVCYYFTVKEFREKSIQSQSIIYKGTISLQQSTTQ